MLNYLTHGSEVQSSIPSCTKRFSALDVKTNGPLRVKRHIVIFTSQEGNSISSKEDEQEEITSSNHIIV